MVNLTSLFASLLALVVVTEASGLTSPAHVHPLLERAGHGRIAGRQTTTYCKPGSGHCKGYDTCAPLDAQCCQGGSHCVKGTYCFKARNGQIGCCVNGKVCNGDVGPPISDGGGTITSTSTIIDTTTSTIISTSTSQTTKTTKPTTPPVEPPTSKTEGPTSSHSSSTNVTTSSKKAKPSHCKPKRKRNAN